MTAKQWWDRSTSARSVRCVNQYRPFDDLPLKEQAAVVLYYRRHGGGLKSLVDIVDSVLAIRPAPPHCAVTVPLAKPGDRIGFIYIGEDGYHLSTLDEVDLTEEVAEEVVRQYNEQLGITVQIRDAAIAGSMFGWKVRAAQPAMALLGKGNQLR